MVCKNNNIFPRIAIFAFLLIILCSVFVGKYIAKRNRMDELSEKYCYEVYSNISRIDSHTACISCAILTTLLRI